MTAPLDSIVAELRETRGIDLSGYRSAMVTRRLEARMQRVGVLDGSAYLNLLRSDPDEYTHLIDAIAINVSSFFRDPLVFELLAHFVLPDIIQRKRVSGSRDVRIWSAGCAAGQETYSLAISLHRALGDEFSQWHPLIFGTDIDGEALRAAAAGKYRREDFRSTQLGVVDEYFSSLADGYAVGDVLRDMVRFSWDDLVRPDRLAPVDSVFGGFDLVVCRNLLIYLTGPKQCEVMAKLYRSLVPGGYLILGGSESLPDEFVGRLAPVESRCRIYCKTE